MQRYDRHDTNAYYPVIKDSRERVIIESFLRSELKRGTPKSAVNEGLLDFVKGLFSSFLSLFGVELDRAADLSQRQTTDIISDQIGKGISGGQVSREDLGLSDDDSDDVKITDIKPKTEKGKEYVKKVVVASSEEVLSGAAAKIQELEGVPAFPSEKNVNERLRDDAVWSLLMEDSGAAAKNAAATEAMADEMEKYQPQINSALEGVGMMKGFAMSLKDTIPDFEGVQNTAKPITPGDVVQLASAVAQKLSDAGVEGETAQVLDFCSAYAQKNGFSLQSGSLAYLPSSDQKGDIGKAAKGASEKGGSQKPDEVDLTDVGIEAETLEGDGIDAQQSEKSIFDEEFMPTEEGMANAEGEMTSGANEVQGQVSSADGTAEAAMAGLKGIGVEADSFEDALQEISENKAKLAELEADQDKLEAAIEDLSGGKGSIKDRLTRTIGMFAVGAGTIGSFGAAAYAHLFGAGAAATVTTPSLLATMPGVAASTSVSGVGGAMTHMMASAVGVESTWAGGTLMGVGAGTWLAIGKVLLALVIAYCIAKGCIWAASKLLDKDEEWQAQQKDKFFKYTAGLIGTMAKKVLGFFWSGIKAVWEKGIQAGKKLVGWFKKKFSKNESLVYHLYKPTRSDIRAIVEFHDMINGLKVVCNVNHNYVYLMS